MNNAHNRSDEKSIDDLVKLAQQQPGIADVMRVFDTVQRSVNTVSEFTRVSSHQPRAVGVLSSGAVSIR